MNGLSVNAQLRAGRRLELPEQLPRVIGAPMPRRRRAVACSARRRPENATAASAPAERFLRGPPRRFAAAHRGARARARGAAAAHELAQGSGPTLYEGQRLRIAVEPAGRSGVAASDRDEAENKVAPIDAARGEAQREGAVVEVVREESMRPIGTGEPTRGRYRSAATVAMEAATTPEVASSVVKAAEDAREPVSAAQAEELSPALGPVSASQALADSIDYQVRDDGSIRVEATETLGQYADWLQIPTQRLRVVNKLKTAPDRAARAEAATRLFEGVTRGLRTAAARLPRQASGRILRPAPHLGHRGVHRAQGRLVVDHDPAV